MYFKDFIIYFINFEYLFDLKSKIKPQVKEHGKENRSFGDTKKGYGKPEKRIKRKTKVNPKLK